LLSIWAQDLYKDSGIQGSQQRLRARVADPDLGSGAFYTLDLGSVSGINFFRIADLFDYDQD
jgi:hypothetical protein